MSALDLRPMGIGDILDVTFRLYRRRFLTFLTISLLVYVPYALLLALLPTPVETGQTQTAVDPGQIIAGWVGFILFVLVLMPLCGAAMVHNISASYLGDDLSAGSSYGRAAGRVPSLLGAQFLAGLIAAIGFLLLIVPGVIFSLWFLVVGPVVILEGAGVVQSLGRSRELMRGNLGKGFAVQFLANLLAGIIAFLLGLLVGMIPWPHEAFSVLAVNLIQALVLPIQVAPTILLYYDLRIRKEAFDLQMLSQAMDQSAP